MLVVNNKDDNILCIPIANIQHNIEVAIFAKKIFPHKYGCALYEHHGVKNSIALVVGYVVRFTHTSQGSCLLKFPKAV